MLGGLQMIKNGLHYITGLKKRIVMYIFSKKRTVTLEKMRTNGQENGRDRVYGAEVLQGVKGWQFFLTVDSNMTIQT